MTKLAVVVDIDYQWLPLLISEKISFLLLDPNIYFSKKILMFNSLLLDEFDQIMPMWPKVAPSWGSCVLYRLI